MNIVWENFAAISNVPINLSLPSAAYMGHWIGSALVQIIACRLFGAKPTNAGLLSIEPLETNFGEILVKNRSFSFKKMSSKMSSAKWRPFCLGGDEVITAQMRDLMAESYLGYEINITYPTSTVITYVLDTFFWYQSPQISFVFIFIGYTEWLNHLIQLGTTDMAFQMYPGLAFRINEQWHIAGV